ncbi:phage infection protein [Nodosilinea sp. LEGE 07088]|uniref:phage infection protein n=1 Tax=Nodosilinea sp. LEGE 07088 TaxID=2777968 RepID=UPI001880DDCD|nr:phage infection protein [Nodosilinea sp. LEGE 07088]MBE9140924.1 phage infection protein [Nodosilinea sp. LEGE 07088]
MKNLSVTLRNCYGIKQFQTSFDFSNCQAIAIYAPNGCMKSSFAKVFDDIANNCISKDRLFPSRTTIRTIVDELGNELDSNEIVVIWPYDEVFGHTEKTSTLLVDATLREEYEQLHIAINQAKNRLISGLKEISKTRKDIQRELSLSFTGDEDKFYEALVDINEEISTSASDASLACVPYDQIFNEKVQSFLNTEDFSALVQEYIARYNELLETSLYFKKGTFNYYNGSTVAKSLAQNGFFDANHTIILNATDAKLVEIKTKKEFESLIEAEKKQITEDTVLRNRFKKIEEKLNKNVDLRNFQEFLLENEYILPYFSDMAELKKIFWKSYLVENLDLCADLVTKHQNAERRKREIELEARDQQTQWESVIEIFNKRFHVPFKLVAKNKTEVILAQEPLLKLGFEFEDGTDHTSVEKDELLQVLSTGEKKALYILNIIFEVEVRKKARQNTLFVIDDIADSFDYKNKYAIIEYLRDISQEPYFYQLLLTHNFDFFRTVQSRFVKYSNCLMTYKSETELRLNKAKGIKNIFVKDWKQHFYSDNKKKIASIPFIRNLIEYTKGEADESYLRLTSMVHWKEDTNTITVQDLDSIFNQVFECSNSSIITDQPIIEVIETSATECLQDDESINFENKVVLSIAARLFAERYMIQKINDSAFASGIRSNQTKVLFDRFKVEFSQEYQSIDVIERVVLMTPESIHLNSFMYEPILDMSDGHLKKLFEEIRILD